MLKYTLLLAGLLLTGAVSFTLVNGAVNNDSKSLAELRFLTAKYGNSAYKAVYSLEETRPYSIIHVDKVSEVYQNKWLSPDSIIIMLDDSDKEKLLKELSNIFDGFSTEKSRKVLDKIRYWSMADLHFRFLKEVYEVYPERILKMLSSHDKTAFLFFHLDKQGKQGFDNLSMIEKDESFNKSLNLISALELTAQYTFYSEIYQELAVIASK